MKSQLFRFFDASPYDLHPVYWLHGWEISRAVNEAYGSDKWRLRVNGRTDETGLSAEVASTVEGAEKFLTAWAQACASLALKAKAKGDMVYMDMEHIPHRWNGAGNWQFAVSMAQTFKKFCPGIKLCCYFAYVADFLNNDWLIRYDAGQTDAEYNERVARTRAERQPFFDLMDCIDIPAYLLGAKSFRRDIDYLKAHRRIVRRFYPSKEIIYSAWGRYHDAWNPTPAEFLIPKENLLEYAKTLTRYGDKVIVFDETPGRDDYFIEQLKLRSEA